MSGIALDGFNKVGDQVVAALELNVDLLPGVLDLVTQSDQAVLQAHEPHTDGNG